MEIKVEKLDLKNEKDIERLLEAIIHNEEFEIGVIEPFKYKLVLDGGRFKDFNPKLIDANIAKIILSIQNNYDILLSELEDKYNIIIEEKNRDLKFSIEKGSGIIETLLESEVIKRMDSKHLMYVLIVAVIAFTGHESYAAYMEHLNEKIKTEEKIELAKLEKTDRKDEREAAQKNYTELIELTKGLAYNKTIQESINKPTRDTLSILKDGEYIKVSKDKKIVTSDKSKYNYKKPIIEDIEEITTESYKIETYNFLRSGKLFKFEGISKAANSETLDASKRIKMMQKADAQETVKVKLKVIKDPVTKSIKNIYILDYIEN